MRYLIKPTFFRIMSLFFQGGWVANFPKTTGIIYALHPDSSTLPLGQRCSRPLPQTWKKTWMQGHCPWKSLRIVEISGLWNYFGINLINCENFFLDIK